MDQNQSQNALHFAASGGNKSLLKKLIEAAPVNSVEIKNCLGQTPLMCCVACNQLECTSVLLKAGARVDSSDNTGQTALHIAVNKGLYRCVKLLLANGALWYQKDLEGVTALHAAAALDSSKCLSAILNELKRGEVDTQDAFKKTALHWCAAYGKVEHVNLLLSKGANVCIPDVEGKTPLHWAATNSSAGALECLKMLIKKVPTAINWQDYEGRSALHFSVLNGSIQMVDFLTSRENCNIHILDNVFTTPLHWAAREGLLDKIALLLDRGAAYTSTDSHGATPMHYAAYHNQAVAIKLFLSRKYVKDVPDLRGRNALIWAAARKADDVIQMMAKYDVDFSYSDKFGYTALHEAAIRGHVFTIELLLCHGAPVNAVDKNNLTPLLHACIRGKAKAVQILLHHGASLLHTDKNERNCLHWAAKVGQAYLCQVLLNLKQQLYVQDCYGKTPLHYCSSRGYVNCVSVFLESGVNLDIADYEGRTPLHVAALNNHIGVVKFLCEHSAFLNPLALLDDEWATPLDCAVYEKNVEIVRFLRSLGGLTSFHIKSMAAKKIQLWIRKIFAFRKKKPLSSSPHRHHIDVFVSNSATEKGNVKAIENPICQTCHSNRVNQPNLHLYSQASSNSSSLVCEIRCLDKHLTKHSSKIPIAEWRLYLNRTQHENSACSILTDHCEKPVNHQTDPRLNQFKEQQAALIIQKVWRRFYLKKSICSMREKISEAFPTIAHRKMAENAWKEQLEKFFESL